MVYDLPVGVPLSELLYSLEGAIIQMFKSIHLNLNSLFKNTT